MHYLHIIKVPLDISVVWCVDKNWLVRQRLKESDYHNLFHFHFFHRNCYKDAVVLPLRQS